MDDFMNTITALEAELYSIEEERENKIEKIINKIKIAIKLAWDKFIDFCKSVHTQIKSFIVKKKIDFDEPIICNIEGVDELKKDIFYINSMKEEYNGLIKMFNREKMYRLASVTGSVLAIVSASAILLSAVLKGINLESDQISENFKKQIESRANANIKMHNRELIKNDLFRNSVGPNKTNTMDMMDFDISDLNKWQHESNLKNAVTMAVSGGIIGALLKHVTKSINESDKKVKLLIDIIQDENLTPNQLKTINNLINTYKKLTYTELQIIYDGVK